MAQRETPQLVPLHRRLVTKPAPFLAARDGAAARQPVEKRQHGRISQRTRLRHKLAAPLQRSLPGSPRGHSDTSFRAAEEVRVLGPRLFPFVQKRLLKLGAENRIGSRERVFQWAPARVFAFGAGAGFASTAGGASNSSAGPAAQQRVPSVHHRDTGPCATPRASASGCRS